MQYTGANHAGWGTQNACIQKVTVDQSTRWLTQGWADMRRAGHISLAYGLVFVAGAWLLFAGLRAAGLGSLILPLAGGFLLIGPIAATGLYEISRRLEAGEPTSLAAAFTAWRRNRSQIGLMGVVLLIAFFVWIQVALIVFALFFGASPPPLDHFVRDILTSPATAPFLLVGTLSGAVLATAVFAISVVALPMLIDRQVTVAEAIATSLRASRENWKVMSGWAAMIALLAAVGLATFFIGLAVALPLVGHASWHAYRALVAR